MKQLLFVILIISLLLLPGLPVASQPADATYQALPFTQNWANTGLITTSDDWSGVPGVVGYRGDDLTLTTGVDPQTILADGAATPVDVNANQTDPNTFTAGGVTEFELANPVIALNGSGTADAPFIVLHLNTTGFSAIQVAYNLRDLDGSADDAGQQVALHYRVGAAGDFTNVASAYVADATTGGAATQVTPVNITLPAAADNQPQLQVRIMTTNAPGNDEWVGVDDIAVTGTPLAGDTAPSVTATVPASSATNVPRADGYRGYLQRARGPAGHLAGHHLHGQRQPRRGGRLRRRHRLHLQSRHGLRSGGELHRHGVCRPGARRRYGRPAGSPGGGLRLELHHRGATLRGC